MNKTFELIPLTIQTRGEVIASNVDEFRDLVKEALAGINRDLKTDEDFGQAELDVKSLKGAEDAVKAAKEKALADAEQLNALFATLDQTASDIAEKRLELEKLITKRKEDVKAEIVDEYLGKYDIEPGLARAQFLAGLRAAIKGKRTVETMRKACEVYQVATQAVISKNRSAIQSFEKAHGKDLTMDRCELELKTTEGVEAELRRRFELKKSEDERKRLEEEAEKAKDEAKAAIQQAEAAAKPVPTRGNLAPKPEQGPWAGAQKATVRAASALTEDAEWQDFRAKTLDAFKALKAAKKGLKFQKNIAKAQIFANAVNAAWKEVM